MVSTRMRAAICSAILLPAAAATLPARAEVTISSAATKNVTCSSGLCAPTARDAVLNAGDLENLLASGNVEVTTTGSGVQAGNIRIDAPLGWSGSSTLTLDAYQSVLIGKPVSVSGQGELTIATNDGGSGGVFSFGPKGHITFANASSALAIDGTSYTLVTTLPALASAIAADPSGAYALASSYNAAQDSTYSAAPIATPFAGNFNGLGNAISHLTIRAAERDANVGLFAYVGTSGSISSLRVTDAHVNAKGDSYAGPLAGISYGSIFNVFASGRIRAAAGRIGTIGGLVGYSENIIRSAASTSVSVGSRGAITEAVAGGLAGANGGTIEQSYATGGTSIAGTATGSWGGGGLVGDNPGTIDDCYAEGSASVPANSLVGGLVGDTRSTVAHSYSTGAPSGGTGSYVGGLLGYDQHQLEQGKIAHDYWDVTISKIKKNQGAGNVPNDPGIKGKTTAQLQSGLPKGFDPKIWAENPKINGGLPYLIANPPQ